MRRLLALLLLLALWGPVRSDEGMWLPKLIHRLDYAELQQRGLQLTPEEIYSVNQASLKDAIVIFGRGCTGEMISAEGLLLTNHHCGYGNIQSLSSTENDYLTEGFWAMTREDELPASGLTASFLIRMEDVTERILDAVSDITDEAERRAEVNRLMGQIAREATEETHYQGSVREFYAGNEYYLFIYEVFTDVRLVGAPPSSIGKFGADTDNWMWPRHTGDFALFRVYMGPDGKPAPYAEENVPYRPNHFLPISIAGVQEGDFSMILGYPGGTDRYLTSWGIDLNIRSTYPTRVDIRKKKMDIIMEDMQADPAVRIQYASKYARISNYWKNFMGMGEALQRLQVADSKRELEERLSDWIMEDPDRIVKYGTMLQEMEEVYQAMEAYNVKRYAFIEAYRTGSELLALAGQLNGYVNYLKSDRVTDERTDDYLERVGRHIENLFKDLNVPTDQKLLAGMLQIYYEMVPQHQQPEMLRRLGSRNNGDFSGYAQRVFRRTFFTSHDKIMEALNRRNPRVIERDPLFQLASAFLESWEAMQDEINANDLKLNRNRRLFIAALREMDSHKEFYPDANFTMRITFGSVKGYSPADAVDYHYLTTMTGIMEKEDPDNWEFVVPDLLKELYEKRDFGPYAMKDGRMPVNFLTDHDITGGNSGSPVINGKGELVGLAFDGNWEALSGDIHFEPNVQRTINVDMRYVLFVIEKFGNAGHLLKEMNIVSTRPVRSSVIETTPPESKKEITPEYPVPTR